MFGVVGVFLYSGVSHFFILFFLIHSVNLRLDDNFFSGFIKSLKCPSLKTQSD